MGNNANDNIMARSSGNINLRRLKKRVQILDEFVDDKFDMEDSDDNYWEKDLRKRTMRRANRQGSTTRSTNNTNNNNSNNGHQSNYNSRRGEDTAKDNYEREEERGGRLLRKRHQKPSLEQSLPQRSLKKMKIEDDEFSDEFENEDYDQNCCLRCG